MPDLHYGEEHHHSGKNLRHVAAEDDAQKKNGHVVFPAPVDLQLQHALG